MAGSDAPAAPTRILLVDEDAAARDAVAAVLVQEGYVCACARTSEQALALAQAGEFHLVLCDVDTPRQEGLQLLDRLRADQPSTAVILLTGRGDTEAVVEGLRRGASDCLAKPPQLLDLVRAIERALAKRRLELARHRYRTSLERRVREKTAELSKALREIESAYASTLYALVAALDAREHETSDHSQRVVRYTLAIAERMGLPAADLPDIARGALLHDIGKIGVPDAILLKPGKLLPQEWEEMRRHPEIGHTILRSIPFLEVPSRIVLAHQERWDGRGYPHGLAGEAIPLGARIFAIADTLDAITSDRPYRRGGPLEKAREEVRRYAGTQFDPRCAEAFLSLDGGVLEALRRPDALAAAAGGSP
ncbi:HD-GYP domain-containing protein [Anaeromyxobacter diazotrophicus]|uniref:HD-GYP domain-containing protein n=1 Tax=Anaeromyxobacter diazotrophicus TaxID=2590199 RepID=UPI0015927998|nr:HD domain-containing phosphohydrolase [Anaeromyxobacter diazotrophicus]